MESTKMSSKMSKGNTDTASLCSAIFNNDFEKVKQLIKVDVDLNSPNDKGFRPLHIALMKNNIRIVELLLNSKKDDNTIEVDMTAWIYAIMLDNREITKLLGNSCSFDFSKATNSQGETLVHYCVKHRSLRMLNYFGISGDSINQVDVNGYSALHLAVINNDTEMIERLLKLGADLYTKTKDGRSSIHFAVKHCCFETLLMLTESNIDVNDPVTSSGSYPLHIAVENSDTSIVNLLIRAGGNLHCKDNEGKNLLHVAVENEDEDMIKLLLKKKVNVNDRFGEGQKSVLDLALSKRNSQIVTTILNYDPDLNSKDKNGLSAIFIALEKNCLKSIKEIFSLKPDLDVVTKNSYSLLHYAIRGQHEDITTYLLENNINIDVISNRGESLLHYAVMFGDAKLVSLLLNKKLDVNARTKTNFTPLHLAVLYDSSEKFDIVNILLSHGAEVDAEAEDKTTPLFHLGYEGKELFKLLLDKGANVNHFDVDGEGLLYYFADRLPSFMYEEDVLSTLIQHNFNFDKINDNNDNIFHFVAEKNLCCVQTLQFLRNKVNVNGVNNNNQTPLNVCLENGANFELVTYLIDLGATMNRNMEGESSLHLAIKAQQYMTVKFLLSIGNSITVDGSTILHYAVQYNKCEKEDEDKDILKLLFLYNATLDVNAKNNDGKTPLHLAVLKGSLKMVETLCSNENIDINVKDAEDNSPLCYAISNKNLAMIKLLLKKGACTSDMHRGMSIYDLAEQSGDKHVYQMVLLY